MSMLRLGILIVIFLSEPALAQTADPAVDASTEDSLPAHQQAADDSEIIVTAPPTTLERKVELRKMIQSIFRKPRAGQTVGTFFDAPCPEVLGIPEESAELIKARILRNAETLGVNRRIPRKNCRPNISVIFVSPEAGPPETWLDYDAGYLRHLLSYERKHVIEERGPVRAWASSFVRTADGASFPDANGRSVSDAADIANQLRLGSRLRSPITVEIDYAIVMIELTSAQGKTLDQLGDYATMRSLANLGGIDPEAAPAAATILTLFQDQEPAESLTVFDKALISQLYNKSRDTPAKYYYTSIAARAEQMEREEGSDKSGE